jgi:hypothetical protein
VIPQAAAAAVVTDVREGSDEPVGRKAESGYDKDDCHTGGKNCMKSGEHPNLLPLTRRAHPLAIFEISSELRNRIIVPGESVRAISNGPLRGRGELRVLTALYV